MTHLFHLQPQHPTKLIERKSKVSDVHTDKLSNDIDQKNQANKVHLIHWVVEYVILPVRPCFFIHTKDLFALHKKTRGNTLYRKLKNISKYQHNSKLLSKVFYYLLARQTHHIALPGCIVLTFHSLRTNIIKIKPCFTCTRVHSC